MRVGIAPLFQNYGDWDRFHAMRRGEPVPRPDDSRILREQFALGDLAEPLGFDSLWTFEHRCTPYILAPNPQQFLSYFAGRTKRIDMGSMVTVMPWHNPVRLAENISLLQHMLGPDRRFYMGLGRGLARIEYESLNVDMNQSRELMAEGLEIVRRALRGETFEYDGEIYKFPRSVTRPTPLNSTPADDAYGVWTSEASMRASAEMGLSALTIPSKSLEQYRRELDDFDKAREAAGFGPASRPILQVFLYCDESQDRAEEKAELYFSQYARSVVQHYELGGEHFKKLKNYDSYVTGMFDEDGGEVTDDGQTREVTKLLKGDGVVGTPERCIERLEAMQEMMEPHEVVLVCSAGMMSAQESTDSLRLFSEKVLPTAKKIGAGAKVVAGD